VWVTVTHADNDIFTGRVINQPTQLRTVRQGENIRFVLPAVGPHPILTTEKYLAERSAWLIHSCEKCGLSELFDAPSDLISVIFPQLPPGATLESFTSFCPLCGGTQVVESRTTEVDSKLPTHASPRPSSGKVWWQFWK
jgi:hypothetical protein